MSKTRNSSDMTDKPSISIIMPVYNSRRYIVESVQSVLDQTYTNWQLLLIDDCSPDDSVSLIRPLAKQDSRIRILHNKKNIGAARSRNRAIDLASGDYIAFLDSDDIWYPDKLERQVALIRESDPDLLYCSYAMIDENGQKRWKDYLVPDRLTMEDMLSVNLIGCLTVMVKASILKEYPFPTGFYHEDYANWMRLLARGYRACGCTEVLAAYRIHSASRSYNKLNAAKERWKIYRSLLHLSRVKSLRYLSSYALSGLKKYKQTSDGQDVGAEQKKLKLSFLKASAKTSAKEQKCSQIAIIGHFGGDELFLDGQTIKTRILYEELGKAAPQIKIIAVDTYEKKKHPVRLLLKSIRAILSSDAIITMVHENGMKLYLPMLYWSAKLFRKKVYQDVIGGDLPLFVRQYPQYRRYLNAFCSNWVETRKLKEELEAEGIRNCRLLPNFKRLSMISLEEALDKKQGDRLNFCTFSRVIKEKGIEDAIEAVREINQDTSLTRCTLTIYGQIGPDYQARFSELEEGFDENIRYGGLVPYDKSTEVLKHYDALLFPTTWVGECFPGTIVDAFCAGLPVLASDWNSNKEIISHAQDGLIYPSEQGDTLKELMLWVLEHPDELRQMGINSLQKAQKYSSEANIPVILGYLGIEKK